MQKSILVLSDGTELSSGRGTTNALMNVQYTELVNSETELTLGSVCASCVEATLITPGGGLNIQAGTEVTVLTEYDDGSRAQEGIFNLEKPTRSSANTYKLIAYDNVVKLDIDLTTWLSEQIPSTLFYLVNAVCTKCGVEFENTQIPHGDIVIQSLPSGTITGRQILQWAAEIAAQFVKATTEGKIKFCWYEKNKELTITSGKSEENEVKQVPYFEGSLSYEDYKVAPAQKVQIRNTDDDVGIVWPPDVEEGNTYVVDANGLLLSCSTDELQYIAQGIYQTLMEFTYVPCKISVQRGCGTKVGDIVTITDINGNTFDTCIMTRTVSGGKEVLESTGSPTRNCSTAVNNREYSDLEKRVFKLGISVDGLKLENRNLNKDYSELEMTVKNISAEVGNAKGDISKLQQTAGQVAVEVADDQGVFSSVINTKLWETKYVDANGEELSGLYFDPLEKQLVFNGTITAGSININGKFVVDSEGNAKLYSAKFFSENNEIGMELDSNGLNMYDGQTFIPMARIGYEDYGGTKFPFLMFWANGDNNIDKITIVQQFYDGTWIGNLGINLSGTGGYFKTNEYTNGLFIDHDNGEVYCVKGNDKRIIYTGEAIAKFG